MLKNITKEVSSKNTDISTVHLKNNVINKKVIDTNSSYDEFISIIHDLRKNLTVQEMKKFNQHAGTSCYEHCLKVAYITYIICKKLHIDYVSATRGAMLHDLFLYDWHNYERIDKTWNGLHAFKHPKIALQNAKKIFELNKIEQDVILNHMWPVTITPPRYKETYVVTFADKISACNETFTYFRNLLHSKKAYKYAYVFLSLIIFRIV